MNMNARVLGMLCVIGNVLWFLDSVRWVVLGGEWDTIHNIAWIIADIGAICGVLGLLALKATGQHPVLRLLTYLPLLGLLFLIAASLVGPNDGAGALIAWLMVQAAMLLVGILALATKGWGWRKITPLLTVLMFPVGAFLTTAVGLAAPSGGSPLFQSLGWIIMGLAIFTSPAVVVTPAARPIVA
jgi:hypothetical protein